MTLDALGVIQPNHDNRTVHVVIRNVKNQRVGACIYRMRPIGINNGNLGICSVPVSANPKQ